MLINKRLIWILIFLALLVNILAMFIPLVRNDDPVLYANIAKNMVLNHNYIDLFSGGMPWLDKPHFPFWLTSFSFNLFGFNSFAYILPGFIFYLLGGVYTYKLAARLYNQDTGLISCLIYFTALHLVTSAYDLRAEAYLLGQIMPALYYWLEYDKNTKLKPLLLASLFTALALMTKGLFVIITIFSGIFITWLYTKNFRKIIQIKWLVAYILWLVFILPELIALYLQFDLHPELKVFGKTHVSGIKWFFWGSQFGRFFNTGPIHNTGGNPFFFVHTFLWAFLPWSIVFIVSIYNNLRNFKFFRRSERAKLIFLWSSFGVTFLVFSLTKFQLDHYTNIIIPFAAILTANYLNQLRLSLKSIVTLQLFISYLLLIIVIIGLIYLFGIQAKAGVIILVLIGLAFIHRLKALTSLERILFSSSLSVIILTSSLFYIYCEVYVPYDVGYNLAKLINRGKKLPVYDYAKDNLPLEFNLNYSYSRINNLQELPKTGKYYLVTKDGFNNLPDFKQYAYFCGNTIDKIFANYKNPDFDADLNCYSVLVHE